MHVCLILECRVLPETSHRTPQSRFSQALGAAQNLKERSDGVLEALTQQASVAPRPLRNAVLAHLADVGTMPDARAEPEALTWWAARLLCVQGREKLEMLLMTDTNERACLLLCKMPNTATAGAQVMQMISDGQSCPLNLLRR